MSTSEECVRRVEEYCEDYCRIQIEYKMYLVEESISEEEVLELCIDECLELHRDVIQECYEEK